MHVLAFSTSAVAGFARPAHRRAGRQSVQQPRHWPAPALAARQWQRRAAAAAGSDPPAAAEEGEGLLPDEDAEVPGGHWDALNGNTKLGKAVKGACNELDRLGELERETLSEAEGLLKQLGYKGSLFAAQQQQGGQQQPGDGEA